LHGRRSRRAAKSFPAERTYTENDFDNPQRDTPNNPAEPSLTGRTQMRKLPLDKPVKVHVTGVIHPPASFTKVHVTGVIHRRHVLQNDVKQYTMWNVQPSPNTFSRLTR